MAKNKVAPFFSGHGVYVCVKKCWSFVHANCSSVAIVMLQWSHINVMSLLILHFTNKYYSSEIKQTSRAVHREFERNEKKICHSVVPQKRQTDVAVW